MTGRLSITSCTFRGLSHFFITRAEADGGSTVLGAYVYRRKGARDVWRFIPTQFRGPEYP